MSWDSVDNALKEACCSPESQADGKLDAAEHVCPGAVLLVSKSGEVVHRSAAGCRSLLPSRTPMSADTVFDIASLTKALVTSVLTMKLVEKGLLTIDRRLSTIFQSFGTYGKEQMTVRHLLTHSSGYPDVIPFYRRIKEADRGERAGVMGTRAATEMVYNEIFRARLNNMSGKVTEYSDVGFILLGDVIEVLNGGKPLDRIATEEIIAPLQLQSTGFIDLESIKRNALSPDTGIIAPTALCPWRKRVLCGEVYDDNAWAMGGVAGHAGLFSTATDVDAIAGALIESYHGRSDFISQEILKEFWTRDSSVPGSTWALGWDTPTVGASSSGQYFSEKAVGHLAFTGCSLWIDPEREVSVTLLTNRVHPSIENTKIRKFRPEIHDLVMTALGYS